MGLVFLALIALTAAAYYSFNAVMNSVIHSNKEIVLPNLAGKSLTEAVEEVSALGLGLRKEGEEFNDRDRKSVV